MRLNIEKLITDLGGASSVAKITGVVRTAPYGWMKRRYISSQVLEKIKEHAPDIDFNDYFEEDEHERKTGSSAGLS
tara:strand:- start:2065 stop:2292 length:228 start_codon:yes stop_codon:yes gene_type:complete